MAAAAAAAMLTLAGCSSGAPDPTTGTRYLAVQTTWLDATLERTVAGTLGLTDGGCFGIASADGIVDPIVFPAGTTMLEDRSGINAPSSGHLAIGDAVVAGADYSEIAKLRDSSIPDECIRGAADTIAVAWFIRPVSLPELGLSFTRTTHLAVSETYATYHLLAKIGGFLALTARDCFGLEGRSGVVQPIVFPAGTTMLRGASGISVPGVGDILIGDYVDGGGGYSQIANVTGISIPPECAVDQIGIMSIAVSADTNAP